MVEDNRTNLTLEQILVMKKKVRKSREDARVNREKLGQLIIENVKFWSDFSNRFRSFYSASATRVNFKISYPALTREARQVLLECLFE